jgi:hypothetical protein
VPHSRQSQLHHLQLVPPLLLPPRLQHSPPLQGHSLCCHHPVSLPHLQHSSPPLLVSPLQRNRLSQLPPLLLVPHLQHSPLLLLPALQHLRQRLRPQRLQPLLQLQAAGAQERRFNVTPQILACCCPSCCTCLGFATQAANLPSSEGSAMQLVDVCMQLPRHEECTAIDHVVD